MKWIPAYATGFPGIDNQHKMLFQMSEDFQAALEDGSGEHVYGSLLISLELYAQTHFRSEEACMTRCHCRAAEENHDAHQQFLETLDRFRARYDVSGFDRADAINLMQNIDDWLSKHICNIDIQLRDYVGIDSQAKPIAVP